MDKQQLAPEPEENAPMDPPGGGGCAYHAARSARLQERQFGRGAIFLPQVLMLDWNPVRCFSIISILKYQVEEKILPALLSLPVLPEDLHLTEWRPTEHSLGNAAFACTERPRVAITASWPSVKWVGPWRTGFGGGGCSRPIALV